MPELPPPEPFVPGPLSTLRPVVTEPVPDPLFACSARVRQDVAAALHARFAAGTELSGDLLARYRAHLAYCHGLGEKFYEAGPSADFTEILFIYRAGSLEEARQLMAGDPFHADGTLFDEWFFEWTIHVPLYKSNLPDLPGQTVEVKVEVTTPQGLVAAFGTMDLEPEQFFGWQQKRAPRPLFQLLHLFQTHGEGGLGPTGIAWAFGPIADTNKVMHILAVPSVEMARFFNESAALARWGVLKDFRYFEWSIHYPVRKATPRHKAILAELLESIRAASPA